MKRGPEKTNISKFSGFGFGLNTASRPGAPTAARPGAPPTGFSFGAAGRSAAGGAAKKPGTSAVSALFKDSLEDDEVSGRATGLPNYKKLSPEMMQAQRLADTLQAEDPSIFQYDEVIDSVKEENNVAVSSQQAHTEALLQKKKVGLVVREGSEACRTGAKRAAKYVEKVLIATDRRRVEQQIVEDRLLKKDADKNKDCETFVTAGFKEELKKRKKFEEELETQDRIDAQKEAANMQGGGKGFADMYRNLLNGGLASSRGGEKIREQAAPKTEVPEEELESIRSERVVKDGVEDAVKEEVKEEITEPIVEETQASKKARLEEEKEQRGDKAMSARERFLARKAAAAAGAG